MVIGFEPNPANRNMAQDDANLNPDLASRICLEEFAVTDVTGTVRFVELFKTVLELGE